MFQRGGFRDKSLTRIRKEQKSSKQMRDETHKLLADLFACCLWLFHPRIADDGFLPRSPSTVRGGDTFGGEGEGGEGVQSDKRGLRGVSHELYGNFRTRNVLSSSVTKRISKGVNTNWRGFDAFATMSWNTWGVKLEYLLLDSLPHIDARCTTESNEHGTANTRGTSATARGIGHTSLDTCLLNEVNMRRSSNLPSFCMTSQQLQSSERSRWRQREGFFVCMYAVLRQHST